jgi:formate--tetrahydrofolate ligase
VVIVATVRALKHHGGCPKADLGKENLTALEAGLPNLVRHVENITKVYGLPAVVAINRFDSDTEAELEMIRTACGKFGVNVALSEVWGKGGAGGQELAQEVLRVMDQEPNHFAFAYDLDAPLTEKIEAVARRIYGADGVDFAPAAAKELKRLEELGYGKLPICMAKTQYSFSDDPGKLGAPEGYRITVRKAKVSAGAGFVVVLTGEVMTMPGLPKVPAAESIDVDENGRIVGLF